MSESVRSPPVWDACHQRIHTKLVELANLRRLLARHTSSFDKQGKRSQRAAKLIEELRALGHQL